MWRSLFAILFLSVCMTNTHAKGSYLPGYVITNQNDTLYGKLKINGSKMNAQQCDYLDTVTNKQRVFKPNEILAYRFINGKYYVSDEIASLGKDRVFLEFLVKGVVDLYYYINTEGEHFFFDRGNGVKSELKNTSFIDRREDKVYQRNNKEYVDSLMKVVQVSVKACEALNETRLEGKSLINLLQVYHKDMCTDNECIVYKKNIEPVKLNLGIMGGCGVLDFYRSNTDIDVFYGITPKTVFNGVVGVYLEQKLNFMNNDLLRYRVELLAGSNSYTSGIVHTSATDVNSYSASEKRFQIFNNWLLSYDLNRKKIRPYVLVGVFAKFTLKSECKVEHVFSYLHSTQEYVRNYSLRTPYLKEEFGPVVGIGWRLLTKKKSYNLDFRYSYGHGATGDSYIQAGRFTVNMSIPVF